VLRTKPPEGSWNCPRNGSSKCDGNTSGVPSKAFLNFMLYEAAVDVGIRPFNITAMCSYPLAKCSVAEITSVRQRHQSVLIKRGEAWEFSPAPSGH